MMCSSVRGVDWDDFQESIIMSQEGESFGTADNRRKVYQVYQGPVYSRTAK